MKLASVLLFVFLFSNSLYATQSGNDLKFHHLRTNISFIDGSRHFSVTLINAHPNYYDNPTRYGKVRAFIVVYEKECNSSSTCNGPSRIVDNTGLAVQLGKAQSTSFGSRVYIAPKYKTARITILNFNTSNKKDIYLNLRRVTTLPCADRYRRKPYAYIQKVEYIKEEATALITVNNRRSHVSQPVRIMIKQNGRKAPTIYGGSAGTMISARRVQVVKIRNVDPYPWLDEMKVKMVLENGNRISDATHCFTSFNNRDYLDYLNSTGDRMYTEND